MTPRTPEQNRRYNRAAYDKRIARGRCAAGCGVKILTNAPWLVCDSCREKQRARYRRGQPKLTKVFLPPAERIAIYQAWRASGLTTRQFAAKLGKSVQSIRSLIMRVRTSIKGIAPKPMGPRIGARSASRQVYPRCKCGLLLPCWNCVTASDAATRRNAA